IVYRYVRAFYQRVPMLANLVGETDTRSTFELTNDVEIQVVTNSVAAPRGLPVLCAVLDEVAFWRNDETHKDADEDVYRAIRPGTITVPNSKIIGISTPYAKRGLLWKKFCDHYGRDSDDVLVVRGATELFNPVVDRSLIEQDMADDEVAATAEYGAEFR